MVGRKNEKPNNNHQAVGRHIGETVVYSLSFHHMWITKGESDESGCGCSLPLCRALCPWSSGIMCALLLCVSDFLLIARAVGVASSGDSCREGLINLLTSTQLGVLTSPRIVESIHVQSWRSTGSACELTLPFVF